MSLKVAYFFSISVLLFFSTCCLSVFYFFLSFAVTKFNSFQAIVEERRGSQDQLLCVVFHDDDDNTEVTEALNQELPSTSECNAEQ